MARVEITDKEAGYAILASDFTTLKAGINDLYPVAASHTSVLNFTKEEFTATSLSQSAAIAYTLGAGPHVDGMVKVIEILSDGVNTITFGTDFRVYNKSSNDIYPSGFQEFWCCYLNGTVRVSIPTYATAGTGSTNVLPSVNAGADLSLPSGTTSATLTGSASDSDGSISSYAWTKTSGGAVTFGTPSAASTTVSGLANGTYVFRLTVTDNKGDTAYDEVTVVVNASSQTLAAPAGFNASATTKTAINLIWQAVPNATGYNIYVSENNATFSVLTAVGAVTSYNHTGLATGDTRYYQIEATASGYATSAKATASARTTTDYDGLGALKAVLDFRGLALNTTNRYGQVDASGNVLSMRSIVPAPTDVLFNRVGSDVTLTAEGVAFNGLGNLVELNKAYWRFLHSASTGAIADLKATAHYVVKIGNAADPNAFFGLAGTGGAASSNTGTTFYWDDRATTPANNRVMALVSRANTGATARTQAIDDMVAPNKFLVLTFEINGAFSDNDRIKVYLNGTRLNIPLDSIMDNMVWGDPSFGLDIGACGNGVGRLKGVIKQVVFQGLIDSEATRDAFIQKMISENGITV